MDYKDYTKKTKDELNKILIGYKETLRDLNFQDSSNKLKNIRLIRLTKKNIARVSTALQNKKLSN